MPPIIEARGLTKTYGKTCARDGLDLVVESGQVVGLLGPDGAGKTTFVRTVATLVRPDAGSIRVGGFDDGSLLWSVALVAVCAPIAVYRYRQG